MNTAISPSHGAARSVSVALAGSGGAGVMTAANLLLEAAAQAGYYGLMTRSSGPQIRGGEAAAMLRIATDPVDGPDDRFDALVAIDWQNVGRFASEIMLDGSSLLVGDPSQGEVPEAYPRIRVWGTVGFILPGVLLWLAIGRGAKRDATDGGRRGETRARVAVVLAAIVTVAVYLIPHSMAGSQLDYEAVDRGVSPEDAIGIG